jgi:hypothetical protein
MSFLSSHGGRRIIAHQRSRLASPRVTQALIVGGSALVGLGIAHYAVTLPAHGHAPKPLALALGACGGVIFLSIAEEQLLLGWLFLAPIFQESAGKNRLGQLLSLGLYTAPPLVLGLKILLNRRRWVSRAWFDALPLLFVAYVFASLLLTSPHTLRSGAVGTLRSFYQTVALGAIVYYMVAYWPRRVPSFAAVCRVILAASVVQATLTTIEWGSGWNLWHDTTWQQAGDVRSIGTLANPALTGAFIGAGIVIALAILCWKGPPQLHRLATIAIVVGLPGLLATKTRGPILATLIAGALCVVLSARSRLLGLAVIALAVLTIVLFWPQIRSSTVYQNRIDQKQNVQIRLVLQRVSIRLAEDKPILGWGYDSFDRIKFDVPLGSTPVPLALALKFTSHDTFLTMVVEYGIVGLALFLLPWAFVFGRAYRAARAPSPDRWFYVAGIAAVFVIGLTATTLDYRFFSFVPVLPWLLLGLMRRGTETTPGSGRGSAELV